MRNILAQCWFDKEKCFDGINGLENYRAEYDDKKKKLGNKPVHDWSSHPSDAFRTFAVSDTRRLVEMPKGIVIPGMSSAPRTNSSGWMVA